MFFIEGSGRIRSLQWSSDRSEDAHSRALLEMVEMWDQIPQSFSNVALWRAYFVLCTVSSASQWQCHLSCNLQPSSLAVKSGSPAIFRCNEHEHWAIFMPTAHAAHVNVPVCSVTTSAANRSIGEVVQSRRRPLLGPSPSWKRLLPLSHLRHY